METVQSLRKKGAKIRVNHFRKVMDHTGAVLELPRHEAPQPCYVVLPNGGSTLVEVEHPSGLRYSVRAKCSDNDNFQYSTGTRVALGRCLDLMEFDFAVKVKFTHLGVDFLVAAEAADRGSFIRFRGGCGRRLLEQAPQRFCVLNPNVSAPQDHSCFSAYPAAEFISRCGSNEIDRATWTPKFMEVQSTVQPA